MKIKTDYKSCSYITAGKEYDVLSIYESINRRLCAIEDDQASRITLRVDKSCAHLDDIGTWELMDGTNED